MTRRTQHNPVALALTRDLLESVADEIAAVCMRTAVSPNIKERRDLSAAVFDGTGHMVAHAAHIPVHLGAMPLSVRSALDALELQPGDVALLNDPYAGGTHLPDITAILPVFDGAASKGRTGKRPTFIVAVRAHHADVGGATPGSMAPERDVYAEGVRIPPVVWMRNGVEDHGVAQLLLANMRDPEERRADLAAQAGALQLGARRLIEMGERDGGLVQLARRGKALIDYASRIANDALSKLKDGRVKAEQPLEIDGIDGEPAMIRVSLEKRGETLRIDFEGTTGPVSFGLNATEAVARSAVYYLVRCLCPDDTPTNDGLLQNVEIVVPSGSLLAADVPHPVAGGNVETSQRVVDVLWLAAGTLWPRRMPAPGAGTMSNWTFGPVSGSAAFPSYYETLPGGAGGGPDWDGAAAVQQHMTNTRSTPIEVLESRWPVRVESVRLRPKSGGAGRGVGGAGLVREIRFLEPVTVACMMTRHDTPPPGAAGGSPGAPGAVTLLRKGRARALPARGRFEFEAGDVLRIETPGGGGWGAPRT